MERGAQPEDVMLHAAFDEARLACLLQKLEPKDISAFLHSCIRSKGFVHPDLDSKRFLPVTRQLQNATPPQLDPITVAKQAAIANVASSRRSKQYVCFYFLQVVYF